MVYSDAGADEYEKEELAEIKSKISHPVFYIVDTNSFSPLKEFVYHLPDTFNFLIDNDFGKTFTRQQFLKFGSFEEFFSPVEVRA